MSPGGPKRSTERPVSLAPEYLRRILRLEAMPENASGTDKSWVHMAHAIAVRHFERAKPS